VNSRFDDTYNSLGLKTSQTTLEGTWNYTYDGTGQLIRAVFASNDPASVPNQDLAYHYDAMGNRTSTVINGVTTAYVPNNMNQYTSVGGVPQTHDANGNLTSDGTNTYVYNSLNKLISATGPSGTTTYTYDALGQRVASTTAGEITQYLTDPAGLGNLASTYNGAGSLIVHFTHGLGLVNQTSAATFFYDFDPLGSTAGLSNAAGGYANSYSYLPFGGSMSATVTVGNVFQFAGQWGCIKDGGATLGMRARSYQSANGRFTSLDPIGLVGGSTNLYAYVNNDPVGAVDPSGLEPADKPWYVRIFPPLEKLYDQIQNRNDIMSKVGIYAKDGTLNVRLESLQQQANEVKDAAMGQISIIPPLSWKTYLANIGKDVVQSYVNDFDARIRIEIVATVLAAIGNRASEISMATVTAVDPNAKYGPAGYGNANFMAGANVSFPYRIEFENYSDASAPAQTVIVTDDLDARLNWATFKLTGVGFGDTNLTSPVGSEQHFQKTLSMTYNGETFNVQVEAGIHGDTGQVYAIFQSLTPGAGLPPANPLTGFLPPEDATGRGQGFLTFTVAPKPDLATGSEIPNVATIVFDAGEVITTNQIDPHDASKGTDPAKEAWVTIDANVPTAAVTVLPAHVAASSFDVAWSGNGGSGGSGIRGYTVYVSDNGGAYVPWLVKTALTSAAYIGQVGHSYGFYAVATSNVGIAGTEGPPSAVTTTAVADSPLTVQRIPGPVIAHGGMADFGPVPMAKSSTVTFTLRNPGTSEISGIGLTLDGAEAADFTVTGPAVTKLGPKKTANFTVTFKPGATGIRAATLHMASSQTGAALPFADLKIRLSGTGGVKPVILTQPQSVMTTIGGAAEVAVILDESVGMAEPITYQWQRNGAIIRGATGPVFSLSSASLTNAGTYRCVIKNVAGTTTSDAVELGVVDVGPNTVILATKTTATLILNAAGNGQTYAW
ncbi:MAG TPA: RHS repeat-associated core domain-containing protein, partial [Prosthecobacter sp.]|nr:RHS repeat-associated core domain-containing protein [Prosthecobacter sp.]